MSYRFTNTDKWGDAWFSNLKPNEKLLFIYLYENCDIAGFIEMNVKRWSIDIGQDLKTIEGALKGLSRGLIYSEANDCIFIRTYLKHQKNLPLNPERNPAHRGIIKRFEEYKNKFNISDINEFLEGASKGLGSPLGNGKGKGDGNGEGKKPEFNFQFVAENYNSAFMQWVEHKRSRREMYKNQESLEVCYNQLLKLSGNNPKTAKEIVEQSIGNNYQGLFPLKVIPPAKSFGIPEKVRDYVNPKTF